MRGRPGHAPHLASGLARFSLPRYVRRTDGLAFRILGPLQVTAGGTSLPLGGAKQRGVLALLLLHANEVVSADRLIDALWGEAPPESAANMLQGYVSHLRKSLDPEHDLIVSQPPGYVLRVARDALDAQRFERLATEGRRLLEDGDAKAAASRLRDALALWRGPALADLAYEAFARADTDRLEELRLVTLETRIDADLALGRHADVVGELRKLVAEHPLRERLRGQLMTALYRGGRQAEALEVYRAGRLALKDELGVDPGPELRELEGAILRHDPVLDAAGPRLASFVRTRPRPAVLVVAAAVVGGLATALVVATQGGTRATRASATPGSDVLIAARTGRIVRQAVAPDTFKVRFGLGSLWSVSRDGELTRIDPTDGRTLLTLGLGVRPSGMAIGKGSVWVADAVSRTLLRIDPRLGVVADRIPLPSAGTEQTQDVAVAAGSVWVAHGGFNPGAWVERLDPRTGRIRHRFSILGGEASALAFGDGVLWVVSKPAGELRRIDPRTNMMGPAIRLRKGACCAAAGGGYVWVAVNPDGAVWKLAADGSVLRTIQLPAPVAAITYGDGAVWATDGEGGRVFRIDPTTDAVRRYPLGHRLTGIGAAGGLVAVGVEQTAQDMTAGLGEPVVGVAVEGTSLFWSGAPTDPALWASWDAHQLNFHYATCARLLNYPDLPGAAGTELRPELAAAWPKVSDGGRRYTFRIRNGYRFSPPSNKPVTAEDVRSTIERVVSPTFPWFEGTAADIVGAAAYHEGRAAHVSGLSVHGDALVIRLTSPANDLPWRLALSPYCVVPASTPVVASGIEAPIPSAGPYYLAAQTDSVAVLKRNPNYGGPRPQHLAAIVFHFGVAPGTAAARIAAGTLDYILEGDQALAPGTAAARRAGSRFRLTPDATGTVRFLRLNPDRPLFADRNRRLAIQYALDRRGLASIDTAIPATRLLTPRVAGFVAAPVYPLRPDARTARRLLRGRHFHAVFATFDPASSPESAALATAVRRQLAAVGIDVTVVPLTNRDFASGEAAVKAARADIVWGGGQTEVGDAVSYLRSLELPLADRLRLDAAARLSPPGRERSAVLVSRTVERSSLFAVYEDLAVPELVSARVGCVVHQPEYAGIDLAALCVRGSG